MAWVVLIASGVLEAVWANALGRSEGLTRPVPTGVFLLALTLSMLGLAAAIRTAYAIWVGIGAVLTAAYTMASGGEPVSIVRILLLAGIVGCVVGLKLVTS